MSKSLFSKLVPPPRIIDIPYAGLDITDDAVRIMFFSPPHFPSGSSVVSYATVPLAPGMVEDGFIKDEAGVKNALLTLLDEYHAKGRGHKDHRGREGLHVRASLPEEKVYLFKTELLSDDEREIRQNIESKIEENVPVSAAEALFEVERTHCGDSGDATLSRGHSNAIVSVAPRKVVNAYLSVITAAGMVPVAFELQAKALARALVPHASPGGASHKSVAGGVSEGALDTHLIVHSMEKKTTFTIVCRGVVVFTSTVKWGREALAEAISVSRRISVDEAREVKRSAQIHGGDDLAKLSAIVEPTVAPLIDEVHRVYAYWMEHSDDNQEIRRVIFSGGDAELISLASNIPASLGLSFTVANVWGNAFPAGSYIPPIKKEDAFDYAAAIGLALPVELE